jgi:hypothetical protein
MPLTSVIPQGGSWFFAAGVCFHADDAGWIDFADDGADAAGGDWITIGGGPGKNGQQHAGGFPVKVAGGQPGPDGKLQGGTIVGGKLAGRLGLHGLTTDDVADHLATVNEHRRDGKSLTEAVEAARATRATDGDAGGIVGVLGNVPNTERAASWWGPGAGRFHWKSGGVLASDGMAARSEGRPGIHTATTSPATRATGDHPGDPHEGLVRRDPAAKPVPKPVLGPEGREVAAGPRPRIWHDSPVYLTGCANPKVAGELKDHKGFGVLLTPGTKGYVKYLKDFSQFAIDNGCFSKGGQFDEKEFLDLVRKATADPETRKKCLFAVAPDVYDPTFDNGPGKSKGKGDPVATIERSLPVLPKIRALGVPAALVAQDGLEDMVGKIPWDAFDVLFIGGSTEFKLLHHEDALAANKAMNDPTLSRAEQEKTGFEQNRNLKWLNLMWQCRAHGKSIHVGRVNSLARMAISHSFGAESADGTFLAFGPDKNLPRLKKWMKVFTDCTELADAIKSDGPIPEHMQKTYDKLMGVKPKKKSRPKKSQEVATPVAGFAVARDPGEVFSVLAARGVQGAHEYLDGVDAAGRRDLAAFLVLAVGSQTTLAVPAAALLTVLREVAEEHGDAWAG